jgi:hypothetical protein
VKVKGSFWGVENSKQTEPAERPKLVKAIAAARRLPVPVLLIPVISRLVRHLDYHQHQQPELQPTVDELGKILELAHGVQIVTLSNPDQTPPEDETILRELASEVKRHKVGQPRKRTTGYARERRAHWFPQARQWHAWGWSCRQMALEITEAEGIRLDPATVWRWLKGSRRDTAI